MNSDRVSDPSQIASKAAKADDCSLLADKAMGKEVFLIFNF